MFATADLNPASLHSGADGYGAVRGTESKSAADRLNCLDAYVKAVHVIIELWEHFNTAVFDLHDPPNFLLNAVILSERIRTLVFGAPDGQVVKNAG